MPKHFFALIEAIYTKIDLAGVDLSCPALLAAYEALLQREIKEERGGEGEREGRGVGKGR